MSCSPVVMFLILKIMRKPIAENICIPNKISRRNLGALWRTDKKLFLSKCNYASSEGDRTECLVIIATDWTLLIACVIMSVGSCFFTQCLCLISSHSFHLSLTSFFFREKFLFKN